MKAVKIYHLGNLYKVYNKDAYILSFITDYKQYNDKQKNKVLSFPSTALDEVLYHLSKNKINYVLVYDKKYKDYNVDNNYDNFLMGNLPPVYYVRGKEYRKQLSGSFIVKYNDEPEEEYIIGNNIHQDTELVKQVVNNNIGNIINIGDSNILIIDKHIR